MVYNRNIFLVECYEQIYVYGNMFKYLLSLQFWVETLCFYVGRLRNCQNKRIEISSIFLFLQLLNGVMLSAEIITPSNDLEFIWFTKSYGKIDSILNSSSQWGCGLSIDRSDFSSNEEGDVIKFPEAYIACRVHLLYIVTVLSHRRASLFFRSRINRIRGFALKACLWLLVKHVVCFIAAFDWLFALFHGINHLNNIPTFWCFGRFFLLVL